MKLMEMFEKLGRPFLLMWVGMTITMVGTQITGFALSVWVFQKTGSVLEFSGMMVAAAVPALTVLPFAGSFADRFDRRHIIIASDSVAALLSFTLFLLLLNDNLQIWHLYTFNFIASIVGAFQSPAFTASVSALLPKEQMVRAEGFRGVSDGMLSVFSPMVAGVLLGIIGLYGIVLLDLVTFCIGTMFIYKAFSNVQILAEPSKNESLFKTALEDFVDAMSYFRKERLMFGLLVYKTCQNCLISLVSIMIIPLVLSNYTSVELGRIMACAGLGGLIGSVLLTTKEDHKRLMVVFLFSNIILSVCIVIAGGWSSVGSYSICIFVGILAGTVGAAHSGALWMRKLPLDRQGRIFALIGLIDRATVPLIAVMGGFAADYIFEPALVPGGAWADSIGVWFCVGKGRGMGLMFIICGLIGVVFSSVALLQKQLRNLDTLVPDGR